MNSVASLAPFCGIVHHGRKRHVEIDPRSSHVHKDQWTPFTKVSGYPLQRVVVQYRKQSSLLEVHCNPFSKMEVPANNIASNLKEQPTAPTITLWSTVRTSKYCKGLIRIEDSC
jgi:hypothetical protein